MKLNLNWITNALFWIGMILILWDFFETVLNSNDTPYRLHHFYWGFILLIISWLVVNREQISAFRVQLKKAYKYTKAQYNKVKTI